MEPRTGASHSPQQADPRLICNPSASWKLLGCKAGQIFPWVVPNPDLIQALSAARVTVQAVPRVFAGRAGIYGLDDFRYRSNLIRALYPTSLES